MRIIQSSQEPSWYFILFMWSLLLFGYLLNSFHSMTTAVLQPYLMQDFNIDTLTVTSIGSMFFYWYLIMQIPVGILLDKFGVRFVATIGSLFTATGTLLFASTTEIWLLYVGRSCIGMGTSVMFICILKFQTAWCKPNIMITMTGIACFVGTLGGIGAQSPLAYLVETFGWRTSLYGIALVSLLNGFAIVLFIKNHPALESTIKIAKSSLESGTSVFKGFCSIFSNMQTWTTSLLYAAFFGSYILIVGYGGTAWLKDIYNMSTIIASSYIIACILGSAIGSVVIGIWVDKSGSKKKPMLSAACIYLLIWGFLVLWGNTMPLQLIPFILFCLGFFSCAFVVCWACVQEVNPKEFSGIAAAGVNMGGFFGPIVLPYLFARIQNSFTLPVSPAAYEAGFTGIFLVVLAGLICGLFVKEPST